MRSLKSVSNKELLNQLKKRVKEEKRLTLEVILALIELERRGLYREPGFRSLYESCTRELKHSESGAMGRIHAARAIRHCPPALAYLRSERVNLTTLSLAWKHLVPELLARISDKSRKDVEAIIAEFQPVPLTPDKTQTVVVEQVVRPQEEETAGQTPQANRRSLAPHSGRCQECGVKTGRGQMRLCGQ